MFALLVVAGCSSEPTEGFREGVTLLADPTQLFLEAGESDDVVVSAVDNQGNPLTFAFVATAGPGIEVRRDSNFLPIYVDDSTLAVPETGERFRFLVTAGGYTSTSFTVSAGGEELVIPVQVVPQNEITATFSNPTPGFGEQVVITAPAGARFTAESEVTLPGAPTQPLTVAVAPDGTTITAVFPPNVASPVTITNVVSDGAPSLVFNPATSDPITSPVVDSLPATLSSTTPEAGAEVTLTVTDPAFTLSEVSQVTLGGSPVVTNPAAPGASSISFVLAPGASGAIGISGVTVGGFAIDLPVAGGTVTAGATVTPLAGTGDPGTAPTIPTPGEGVTSGVVDNPSNPGFAGCGAGVPCAVYQFVVPADGEYDFTATWEGTSDVGIYFFEPDGATLVGNTDCDSHGNATDPVGPQPEACTQELVAGSYIVAVAPFGPFYDPPEVNPNWLQLAVTPHVAE